MKFKGKIFFATLTMFIAGTLVFAQVKVSLTILCNTSGAQVYLNDNLAGSTSPNLTLQVFPSTYTIRVAKAGFNEFRTTVAAVQSPITIIVNLKEAIPQTPSPSLPPSYQPVPPPSLISPSPTGRLFIDADIRGATVFINGAYAGTTPYQGVLQRGNYVVRISAPGYADYTDRVFVDGYTRLSISLSPLTVEYEIKLPKIFSNHGNDFDKPGDSEMQLYIDGNRLEHLHGRTTPGKHIMTLIYRNLRLEDEFEVFPGRPVTIELSLDVKVY
jgi:hypothetical protein